MKRILLLVVVIVTTVHFKSEAQNSSVWTERYQQKLYDHLDSVLKYRMPDEKRRSSVITEMIATLKIKLPGGVESIPADSLKKIELKIGVDNVYAHYKEVTAEDPIQYLAWSDATIQMIRNGILNKWPKNDLALGNKFCDCIIVKLKKDFPDKFVLPASKEEMVKIVNQCKAELMPGNNK